MSGIDVARVAYGTSMVRSTFADDIGNLKVIVGTGFWLALNPKNPIFITNRHNFDPTMKLGSRTKFSLHKVEIQLRQVDDQGGWLSETEFFSIWNPVESIHFAQDTDCAIVANFSWEYRKPDFRCGVVTMKSDEIADQDFFCTKLKMKDHISFVGFPGGISAPWFDVSRQLPIARSASIASMPEIPVENPSIPTKDVTLVSGMSFAGSSGSPVFSLQKGIPLAGGVDHDAYAPPRLIGIMSGHF